VKFNLIIEIGNEVDLNEPQIENLKSGICNSILSAFATKTYIPDGINLKIGIK